MEGFDEDGAGLSFREDGLCGGEVEVRDGVDLDDLFIYFEGEKLQVSIFALWKRKLKTKKN